jgi:DHA1 family multidrug/chloramphenicol efflux transport protein-like MFS transporter
VAYVWGGSGLFNLFNLISGLCWLALVALFLSKRRSGDATPTPNAAL